MACRARSRRSGAIGTPAAGHRWAAWAPPPTLATPSPCSARRTPPGSPARSSTPTVAPRSWTPSYRSRSSAAELRRRERLGTSPPGRHVELAEHRDGGRQGALRGEPLAGPCAERREVEMAARHERSHLVPLAGGERLLEVDRRGLEITG